MTRVFNCRPYAINNYIFGNFRISQSYAQATIEFKADCK